MRGPTEGKHLMKIFKRLQRHIDTALAGPTPAPYKPRTTVQSDGELPVRYTGSPADNARLDAAVRREVLRDTYFPGDAK